MKKIKTRNTAVRTVPKSNQKIVERETKLIPLTHIRIDKLNSNIY